MISNIPPHPFFFFLNCFTYIFRLNCIDVHFQDAMYATQKFCWSLVVILSYAETHPECTLCDNLGIILKQVLYDFEDQMIVVIVLCMIANLKSLLFYECLTFCCFVREHPFQLWFDNVDFLWYLFHILCYFWLYIETVIHFGESWFHLLSFFPRWKKIFRIFFFLQWHVDTSDEYYKTLNIAIKLRICRPDFSWFLVWIF